MTGSLLRILAAIRELPWAITECGMDTIQMVLDNKILGIDVDLEAVAAKLGRPLENTGGRVTMRGDVAVVDVGGPIFRYANLLTEISGATSIEMLSQNLETAFESPAVRHVLLNINSAGGQVDGVNDLAKLIREGTQRKPVTAFVDGMAASGAYWIASAANRIVASETSLLGSIGVVLSVTDNRDAQQRQGVKRYEIVSTKSPLKRTDPATDEGRAQMLKIVDSLAEVFITRVAQYRGVSTEAVEQNYGRGGMMIAGEAMAAGMADEILSFEGLIRGLSGGARTSVSIAATAAQGEYMPESNAAVNTVTTTSTAPLNTTGYSVSAIPPNPGYTFIGGVPGPLLDERKAERERCAAIIRSDEAKDRTQAAYALAFDTDLDQATARVILGATPAVTAAANPLATAMQQIPNPKVGSGKEAGAEPSEDDLVAQVLGFAPKANRRTAA